MRTLASTRVLALAFAFVLAASAASCRVPDAGPADAALADMTPPPADSARVPPDGGSGFCEGPEARVDSRGGLASPAPVTSSRLILNCCDGVVLRFHVESVAGVRPSLMIRGMGGRMPSGDLDLGNLPNGVEVSLFADDTAVNAKLTGTAHLEVPVGQSDPIRVRACVTASAPGSPLDGARLYTPDFPVMPWGWDTRFSLSLLADRSITAAQAIKQPLAGLVLAPEPLIRISSLAWYERSTHRGHWDAWSGSEALRNMVGPVGTQGVPFVVVADGQRIYLGAFYSLISSQSFAGPVIVMENLTPGGFEIEPWYPPNQGGPDPRADARILKVLGESGKLAP